MIEETKIKRIENLREGGATINETAKAVGVSESTVQRYSSSNKTASNKNKNIINALNETWMGKLFWDGWENDIDLMQIFFNFNRLANKTGRDLDDFLEAIERTVAQYYRYSDTPLKLFDIFLDISSNMTFLEEGYNIDEFTKVFERVYDNHIFIRDLEEKYNSIEEFKEAKEEELEQVKKKLVKNVKESREFSEFFSAIINRGINTISTQKAYYKKKSKKLKSAKTYDKKIKELKLENYILNQVISEFEQKFPLEVKQYIEEIKNQELQCKKTTNS